MLLNLILLASCLTGANPVLNSDVDVEMLENSVCEVTCRDSDVSNDYDDWTLLEDYNSIKNANPDHTHEQIVAELYRNKESNRDYSYDGNELTDDEFWTIVLNLWPHQYQTAYTLTIRAVEQAETYYPDLTRYLDDGDAFRHTYWSALLSYEFGTNFAIQLTTAHESNTPEGIDKEMDLHNNNNGTILFDEWQSKFSTGVTDAWSEIGEFIYHCVANGEVYDCQKVDTNTQKLVYTTIGGTNITKFSIRSFVNSVLPVDYGYEQQYYFYLKNKSFTSTGGATINTRRLRTGYIEQQYIVLSPKRSGAGSAVLDYYFDSPVNSICIDLALWSDSELLNPNDSYAIICSSTDNNFYTTELDLLNDVVLPTNRLYPTQYRIDLPAGTTSIKIATSSPAVGDRNKGRICVGNLDVLFANPDY